MAGPDRTSVCAARSQPPRARLSASISMPRQRAPGVSRPIATVRGPVSATCMACGCLKRCCSHSARFASSAGAACHVRRAPARARTPGATRTPAARERPDRASRPPARRATAAPWARPDAARPPRAGEPQTPLGGLGVTGLGLVFRRKRGGAFDCGAGAPLGIRDPPLGGGDPVEDLWQAARPFRLHGSDLRQPFRASGPLLRPARALHDPFQQVGGPLEGLGRALACLSEPRLGVLKLSGERFFP